MVVYFNIMFDHCCKCELCECYAEHVWCSVQNCYFAQNCLIVYYTRTLCAVSIFVVLPKGLKAAIC